MSAPNETIRDRLAKIKRLAESGSPGERENAARMLKALLEKHKMTEADLESDEIVEFRIDVLNEHEISLAVQIFGVVTGQARVDYYAPRKRSYLLFEATRLQAVEVKELCDHYLPAYRESAHDHLRAFMSSNGLHLKDRTYQASELPPDELAAILRAHEMSHAIKPTPAPKKRLPTPKQGGNTHESF